MYEWHYQNPLAYPLSYLRVAVRVHASSWRSIAPSRGSSRVKPLSNVARTCIYRGLLTGELRLLYPSPSFSVSWKISGISNERGNGSAPRRPDFEDYISYTLESRVPRCIIADCSNRRVMFVNHTRRVIKRMRDCRDSVYLDRSRVALGSFTSVWYRNVCQFYADRGAETAVSH